MNIGIICPSEIALRRFMPALQKVPDLVFVGLGIPAKEDLFINGKNNDENILEKEYEKAKQFTSSYGGKIFKGYENIATTSEIDAIYIPLPPALHYKWAKIALQAGKHVFVEKPSTLTEKDSVDLINTARSKNLALHENYMFSFHDQLKTIDSIIKSKTLGDVRLYRIDFGFPLREKKDFRYSKALGGGALFDAGGYTIKYACHLLGKTARIVQAKQNYIRNYEVDMFGSATLVNEAGQTAQISFGMDNNYRCSLDVWGSKGSLKTNRVLTAPAGFVPTATIKIGNDKEQIIELPPDDSFFKSINHFIRCIIDKNTREETYKSIQSQAMMIDVFKEIADPKKFLRRI